MATQSVQMTVQPRTENGTRPNRRLRKTGLIPAVIYGHKLDVIPISVPNKELLDHLKHGSHVFDLAVGDRKETVLVKEIQYNHLGDEVLHVDFARVRLDEKVKVTVPLELKGIPKGVAGGGVLQQIITDLEVECLVLAIPEVIRHSVTDMALNDVLHVKDVVLPEGVRVLVEPDQIVASVREVVEEVVEVAPAEAGAAEPEVIGKKPAEGEEGAEAPAAGAAAADKGGAKDKGGKEKK